MAKHGTPDLTPNVPRHKRRIGPGHLATPDLSPKPLTQNVMRKFWLPGHPFSPPAPRAHTPARMSGRCRRLPAHTPLRTVRESFPSYGSSPHKAIPDTERPAVR